MASKTIEWRVLEGPAEALSDFRASQGPLIEKRGYRVDGEGPRSLTYKRRHTIPAERFTVEASAHDGGSVITVEGKLHRKLRKAFSELADQPAVKVEAPVEEADEPQVEVLGLERDAQPEAQPEEEIEATIEIETETEPQTEPQPERPAPPESALLREVRASTLMAEGASRRLDAEAAGEEIESWELRDELERVYDVAGHPEAFGEAVGKVQALAEQLVLSAGCSPDEALYIAYRRSLEEHREYLTARGIPQPVAS